MSKVFIGLPVYNGAAFLDAALRSLTEQTFGDFHVLISDNASSDATPEIARHHAGRDSRISYHRHEKNLGAAPNFNFCVAQAEGEYFKWMAHDDLIDPSYLERCVAVLDSDSGAVLCQARVRCIDDSGAVTGTYQREWNFNHKDPATRFGHVITLNHSCVTVFGVMRLEQLRKTPAIAPFVGSDRTLLSELSLHGRLEYCEEELFYWREHKDRSVRISDRKALANWYDANAKGVMSRMFIRQLLAHQKGILRAPLSAGQKSRAFLKTLQWSLRNWRLLARDIRALGGALLGSSQTR